MPLEDIAERVLMLDQLLKDKKTGNVQELAEKLRLSRRQVFNYLKALERIGRSNEYSRQLRSYIYVNE